MVSHYYHFLFACLIPLIDFSFTDKKCYLSSDMMKQFGPFENTLTNDLSLCTDLSKLSVTTQRSIQQDLHQQVLPSYDIYDNILFMNESVPRLNPLITLPHINKFFKSLAVSSFSERTQMVKKTILIIERHMEPKYKQQKRGYKFTSGSMRRMIKNHESLVEALRLKYKNYEIRNVILEGKSIVEQYVLFNSADIVIAQHGAALSNIIFMNNSFGHVVEISPPFSRKAKYFRNLAMHVGVSYSSVLQVSVVLFT